MIFVIFKMYYKTGLLWSFLDQYFVFLSEHFPAHRLKRDNTRMLEWEEAIN